MTDGIIPVSANNALSRLMKWVDIGNPYRYGSGTYHANSMNSMFDVPWSLDSSGVLGCDCVGALAFAYALVRHRPGFNTKNNYGRFDILDIEDDINSNSLIGDALHKQDLFIVIPKGELLLAGDLLVYPTISLPNTAKSDWIRNDDHSIKQWIGHGAMVKNPNGARAGGSYSVANIIQCYGPNGRKPAIRITDGAVMDHHDNVWPAQEHRTVALRLHPRFAVS